MGLAIMFDTLAYSQTLKKAGMDAAHADALAEAQKQAMVEMMQAKDIATQADILRLESKIENSKNETLKWLMGMFVAQTALIVAVITYLK